MNRSPSSSPSLSTMFTLLYFNVFLPFILHHRRPPPSRSPTTTDTRLSSSRGSSLPNYRKSRSYPQISLSSSPHPRPLIKDRYHVPACISHRYPARAEGLTSLLRDFRILSHIASRVDNTPLFKIKDLITRVVLDMVPVLPESAVDNGQFMGTLILLSI
jgi:hypothetical protein